VTEQDQLLETIAETIKTYREGEIRQPDAEHVGIWASQFSSERRLPFLREFARLMERCFLTRESVLHELASIVEEIGQRDMRRANFLAIQRAGQSQFEMLTLLNEYLKKDLNMSLDECGSGNELFIYVDDLVCTGDRASSDLEEWIATAAPKRAHLAVVTLVCYSRGGVALKKRLDRAIRRSGKDIEGQILSAVDLENGSSYVSSKFSEVFWPSDMPDDPLVKQALRLGCPKRQLGHTPLMFSSEEGRHVLEQEFLLAGARIRSMVAEPKPSLGPLGYGENALGFGSTVVTYRNCSNNCPLAMWWGDPLSNRLALNSWYPLFPRKTYSDH
jgi:hypothetical protein